MDDMKIAAQLAEFACNAMLTAENSSLFEGIDNAVF